MKKNINKWKSKNQDNNLEIENNNDLDVEYESYDDNLDYDESYEEDLMIPERSGQSRSIKQVLQVMGGLSFVGISGLLVATSVAISTQSVKPLGTNPKLFFDNKTFDSKEELMEYAQANYFQTSQSVENRINWSINEKGQNLYFNDPKLLREHLMKEITQTNALTSKNFAINGGGIGEVSANDFSNLYFNKTENDLKTTIYRGKNNSIHQSEKSAKDSYLSMHDAYYFNNIYFRNIEELKLYLKTVYYVENGDGYNKLKVPENIGIVGPDGISSSPINSKDLFYDVISSTENSQKEKTQLVKKDFINSVSAQARKYIEIKNEDNRYFYASEADLKNPNADILSKFDNPSYTTLHSNQGIGSYVIDLHKDDENTLFGSYYARTPGDFVNIKNPDQWKKIEKDDPLITEESNSNLLSGFMNQILMEGDDTYFNDKPFDIKYLNESLVLPFYKALEQSNPRVYQAWLEFSKTIKKGKRYNSFNALPISFIFLIENLVTDQAKEGIIQKTKVFFNEIAKHLDMLVNLLLPKELLKIDRPNSKYGDYLSFEKIFNFTNNDLDLSVNLEYFINEISSNFSQFVVAINIISQASLNAMYNGGVLPYKQDHIRNVLNFNRTIVKDSNIELYKKVWEMFSATSADAFKEALVKRNGTRAIDNNLLLEDLAISIVITNSLFSSSEKYIFETFFKEISYTTESAGSGNAGVQQTIRIINDKYGILNGINKRLAKRLIDANKVLTWENFILIKFLAKCQYGQMTSIDFGKDQVNLKTELENIVQRDIEGNKYSPNFIINQKVSENLSIISKVVNNGVALAEGFGKHIQKLNAIFQDQNKLKIEEIVKSTLKVFNETGKLDQASTKKLLDALGTSGKFMASVSKAIPYVQMALVVLDLAIDMFVPVTKYASYVYENSNGNKYIWNGGKSTTMFFGLAELSSSTIKDMKMLDPQKVGNGRSIEEYYFNGERFTTRNDDKLKKAQLRAILNNEYQSNNVRVVYSMDNISTKDNVGLLNPSDKVFSNFGTINDLFKTTSPRNSLLQYVYNSIANTLNTSIKLYHVDKFVFANGHVATRPGDAADELIKEVIDKIQPVKIAMLPLIENNRPKYNDTIVGNNDDNSMLQYILPSVSWTHKGYSVNENGEYKYIIFDPNQEGKSMADSEVELKVKELFYASFDINTKEVIGNEITNYNVFSSMSSSILNTVVFEVRLDNNEVKYFFDQMSAFSWLLSKKNFTLYSYTTTNDIYKFEDKLFTSKDEFISFILNNATTVLEGK